jgi:hypothetical protein
MIMVFEPGRYAGMALVIAGLAIILFPRSRSRARLYP